MQGDGPGVNLSFDRKGLGEDEENEQVAAWTSGVPVPGTSELVLSAPAGPWAGESVEVVVEPGSASGDMSTGPAGPSSAPTLVDCRSACGGDRI